MPCCSFWHSLLRPSEPDQCLMAAAVLTQRFETLSSYNARALCTHIDLKLCPAVADWCLTMLQEARRRAEADAARAARAATQLTLQGPADSEGDAQLAAALEAVAKSPRRRRGGRAPRARAHAGRQASAHGGGPAAAPAAGAACCVTM